MTTQNFICIFITQITFKIKILFFSTALRYLASEEETWYAGKAHSPTKGSAKLKNSKNDNWKLEDASRSHSENK